MTSAKPQPRALILYVLLIPMWGTAALAQDSGFSLGLGAYSEERAYGDTVTGPVPLITYDSPYFSFSGASADLKLPWISTETVSLSFRAALSIGEGYDGSDTDILDGMDDREGGFWTGAAVEWNSAIADFSLEGLADVSGDSDGHRVRLEMSRDFKLDRVVLTPRLVGTWMDDEAVDYFYGVRAGEATLARPEYQGEATTSVTLGLRAAYLPAANHMIVLDLSATQVGDGISDSPITVDDTLTGVGLGYIYRF